MLLNEGLRQTQTADIVSPLSLLRANRKQANQSAIQANGSVIYANGSAIRANRSVI